MTILNLSIACPVCQSKEIVYSCEPACCFNHVCSACLNSFELSTRDLGETMTHIIIETGEKATLKEDTCAPTVDCARCKGLDVFMTGETPSRTFCATCRALLELVFASE